MSRGEVVGVPADFPGVRFGLLTCLGVILAVCPAGAAIKITQIMYDMHGTDDQSWEWVEIYNTGPSAVNLAGYVLDDGNGTAHSSANIAGGTVPAGGFAYLYSADQISYTDFIRRWGKCNAIGVTDWVPNGLNNTGDKVGLWSSFAAYSGDHATHANAVDSVTYTNASPWPVSNDSGSIYLTNLTADNHVGGNWALAAAGSYGTSVAGGRVVVDNSARTEYAAMSALPRLKIVQIMYDVFGDPDPNSAWEWVEVYNDGPMAANLSGYVFSDGNSATLSGANISSGIILPKKTAYLFNGELISANDFIDKWGRTNAIAVSTWPSTGLENTSDTVGLWSSYSEYSGDQTTHARAIDSVTYSSASPWPVSTLPRAIYLKDIDADHTNGANWATALFDDRGKTVSLGRLVVEDQGGVEYGAMDFNPWGYEHVFGYRSFTGTRPTWVSPLTSAGNIVHETTGDVVLTNRGTGFGGFYVTDFDGSTEFLQGTTAIDTRDLLGDDSFTIQGWFKADSVTNTRTIFSNTEGNNGFSLKVVSGKLRGEVRFNDNSGALVNTTIGTEVSSANIATGKWYYAAFRVQRTTSTYKLGLYLDGELVSSADVSGILPNGYVRQSTERPMIAAEPAAGTAGGSYWNGQIYGVRVSNYPLDLAYLQLDRARDGGRYLNDVSYHDGLDVLLDYRFARTAANPNYTAFWSHFAGGMYVPFLNDNYVPQGLCYNSTTNYLYLSMYWRNTNGSTGTYPSLLVEIDKSTNKTRRVFQLKDQAGAFLYKHVAAIAYYNGNIYVPDGAYVYRYDLTSAPGSYVFNPETFANPKGDQNPYSASSKYGALNLQSNTTMQAADVKTDYNGDVVFWTSMNDDTNFRQLLGYTINPTTKAVATTPTHVYNLPILKLQGLVCYSATATQLKFYMSASGGDNDSTIYDVVYTRGTANATSCVVKTLAPAGVEDLVMVGDELWSSSESAAAVWQKYTEPGAWFNFFPLIFGLDIDAF